MKHRILPTVLAFLLDPVPLLRSQEPSASGAAPREGLRLRYGGGLELVYDDNIYNLDDDRIDRLEDDAEPNNRFSRMDSPSDLLFRFSGHVDLRWKSLAGRDAELRFEPRATLHLENEYRNYADFDLRLVHETWRRGEAILRMGFTPYRFRKNYFETGVDLNGNGNISQGERIYDHGIYSELEFFLGLRSRIYQDLSGGVGAGYRLRSYQPPFTNRDEDAFSVEAELDYELWNRVTVGLGYVFGSESTDDGLEDDLLDETVLGELDGIPGLDQNALVETSVDRSNLSHEIGPRVDVRIVRGLNLNVFYRYRFRDYTSSGDLDLSYRGREDDRHAVGFELEYDPAPWARLTFGYTYVRNDADQPNRDDPEDEETSYEKNVLSWGALFRF